MELGACIGYVVARMRNRNVAEEADRERSGWYIQGWISEMELVSE